MAEKQEIETRVNKLIDDEQINTVNGIDIVSLAKQLGFVVGTIPIDDNCDGFIMVDEDTYNSVKIIAVNKNLPFHDKRFVIAHEIAHYIMDFYDKQLESPRKIYANREHKHGRNQHENDIDYFAACLLMPKEIFKIKYKELKDETVTKKVSILSDFFKVTTLSVLRRIEELDLLQET